MLMRPISAAKPLASGKKFAAKLVADNVPEFCTSGALSEMVPAGPASVPTEAGTCRVPLFKILVLASSKIRPARRTKPAASTMPLLLTTPLCKRLADLADRMIRPPGARTAFLFSTKVLMVAAETITRLKAPLPSNFSSKDSPAAMATVPKLATITPLFRTSGASKAM